MFRPSPHTAIAALVVGAAVIAAALDGLPLVGLSLSEGRYEPWRDLAITGSMLRLSPGQRDYIGPGFARDRDYGVFLRGVEKAAPEADRFFLVVPDRHDWYRYRAAYRLAPTPVEPWAGQAPRRSGERDLLLVWRSEIPGGWEPVTEITGGGVIARRSPSPEVDP